MRLLIITPQAPEQNSTFIKAQIKYLMPYKILHTNVRPYICDNKSILGFPLNLRLIQILIKRFLPWAYTYFYTLSLSKFIIANRIDYALINYGPHGANVANAFKKTGVPFIVHFHGADAFVYKVIKKYKQKYIQMFQGCDRCIAVSKDMVKQLILLGCPAEKILLNSYGIDCKLFSQTKPGNNDKLLLFLGNYTEKKSPDLLILAFNEVLKKIPDARLIMIGKGPMEKKVKHMIKELKLDAHVQLLKWQTPEEISNFMKISRAYVQHSKFARNGDSEGTPLAILEASICGLPVISTFHAGIKEAVIHNQTGFLVEEGDWQAMAGYMEKIITDPKLAGTLGQAAHNHAISHYSIEKQMNELIKLIYKKTFDEFYQIK